jgi:hypothetical protein
LKVSNPKANTVYYLALLDWGEGILTQEEMEDFAKTIIPDHKLTENWITGDLDAANFSDQVSEVRIGYYHSRIIFYLTLNSELQELQLIRKLREELQEKISKYLLDNILPAMKKYLHLKNPRVFIYPIFEIKSDKNSSNKKSFWNFKRQKPYSLPTTCFYTELADPHQGKLGWLYNSVWPRKVRMRLSGAKIITSEMSDWFFWNLINLIFDEGLYKRCRKPEASKKQEVKAGLEDKLEVKAGLEDKLEDFAKNLMKNFYEISNARVQDLLATFVLVLTILGVIIAFLQFALPFLPRLRI